MQLLEANHHGCQATASAVGDAGPIWESCAPFYPVPRMRFIRRKSTLAMEGRRRPQEPRHESEATRMSVTAGD